MSAPAAAADAPTNIELYGDQALWLKLMMEKFHLASVSAALGALIAYCRRLNDADRDFVFKRIRCRRCGLRLDKKERALQISANDAAWLQQVMKSYNHPSTDKSVRVMLDFAQEGKQQRYSSDAEKAQVILQLEQDIFATSTASQ